MQEEVDLYMRKCIDRIHDIDLPISLNVPDDDRLKAMCGYIRALILEAAMVHLAATSSLPSEAGFEIARKMAISLSEIVASTEKSLAERN